MRRLFALTVLLSLVLAFAACGGGDDDEATPTGILTAEDIAPGLVASLGAPATLHSPPVTETFGPDGGELELADGAVLEVPEGAFEEDTEVTVAIIDFDMGEEVEATRAYQVAPDGGLGLFQEPLNLRAANIGSNANALEFAEGEFRFLDSAEDGQITFTITDRIEAQVQRPQSLYREGPEERPASVVTVCPATLYEVGGKNQPLAIAWCIELFGQNSGVFEDACRTIALKNNVDPAVCDQQEWVAHVVEETRIDLERAGVDSIERSTLLSELKSCLKKQIIEGATQEAALSTCESLATVPTETAASPTPSATSMASPTEATEQVTDPPTAAPTPAPTPTPTAAPQNPTVSFVQGPTGFIVREYDHTEDLCAGDTCRDYDVSGRVAWSGLVSVAYLQCYGSGRSDEGFRVAVDPPSGEMAFDLTVNRWQFDSHPNIFCELLAPDDSLLDARSAPLQVQ
jgi:hypothetical protein